LSADGQPHEIDFTPPPPSATATPQGNSADSKTVAAEPIEITYGLVCLISSTKDDRTSWAKWIEIHPVLPSEYVQVHVRYTGQEVVAEVRPRPGRMPALTAKPIEVIWDTRGEIPVGAQGNDRAAIRHDNDVVQLRMALEPHRTRTTSVRLNVDGYPRAFDYRVRRNGPNDGEDLRPDARQVRIEAVSLGDREYRVLPPLEVASGATNETAKKQVFDLQAEGFAAFPQPVGNTPLTIALQVDAPANVFSVGNERRDVLEIGFAREGSQMLQLYCDRQMQAWVEHISPTGIAVNTVLTDLSIPLDLAGLRGPGQLEARLAVSQGEVRRDAVNVVIDAEPPQIARPNVPRLIEQGQPLLVYMEVVDQSGPRTVEIGLVANRDDELKKESTVTKSDFVRATSNNWPVSLQIPTRELKPEQYFVKARVTDRVGYQTTNSLSSITLRPPPAVAPQEGAGPTRGTLSGVVRFGRSKAANIKVTLKELGKSTQTDVEGRFSFRDVDAGKYTVEARGSARNVERSGQRSIELKSARDFADTWEIAIE
jgi:hypothetical protein